MLLHTPLHDSHVALGARMVDFGGWDMPVNYGSQIEEHHAVRRDAGMFDVSHMCVVDVQGPQSQVFLRRLLANDVGRLTTPGKALYSCMLREDGGVIDDVIVYCLDSSVDGARYRVVVNAGTRAKDLSWMRQQAPAGLKITERQDLAMIAVQGPNARERALAVLPEGERGHALALEPFFGVFLHVPAIGEIFLARTGYTGEDGWEIMLPAGRAVEFWNALRAAGIACCGLGARDTLRLEAGMNLYGSDMDESTHPLESGLGWTIAWNPEQREFIGRSALQEIKTQGSPRRLVGLLLEDRGVLRGHQRVVVAKFPGPADERAAGEGAADPAGEGEVTSGGFSPTLERSIGLARVPAGTLERVQVDIRGKLLNARVVKPPFVRNGKPCITL